MPLRRCVVAPLVALCLATAAPATAGVVEKEVPFALDQWVALDSTDGPVTLHRVRLQVDSGALSKAGMTRPGESHSFLQPVQVELEYTNAGNKDWQAHLRVVWVDADGKEIDGFLTKENLDHEEAKEKAKSSMATLRYALERAATLRIRVETRPD